MASRKFLGNRNASADQPQQSKLAFKSAVIQSKDEDENVDPEIASIPVPSEDEQIGPKSVNARIVNRDGGAEFAPNSTRVSLKKHTSETSKIQEGDRDSGSNANSLLDNGTAQLQHCVISYEILRSLG